MEGGEIGEVTCGGGESSPPPPPPTPPSCISVIKLKREKIWTGGSPRLSGYLTSGGASPPFKTTKTWDNTEVGMISVSTDILV